MLFLVETAMVFAFEHQNSKAKTKNYDESLGNTGSFKKKKNSKMRFKHIDEEKQEGYKCKTCGKYFDNLLTRHISLQHPGKEFKCDESQKVFNRNDQLKIHKARVHRKSLITWKS